MAYQRYVRNNISRAALTKEDTFTSLATIVMLILYPIIGLFLLFRKSLKWNFAVKLPVCMLTVLYLPFHTGITLWLFLAGGIYYIGPHDTQALQYLKDRYHEEFVVVRSAGSDMFGGSHNYDKWIAPKNNPELEFRVSKCLGRCEVGGSTKFSDTYPQKKWTKQLTARFKNDLALRESQRIDVFVNSQHTDDIIDARGGIIPEFYTLTAKEKNKTNVSVHYKENGGSYTPETRDQHAAHILKIAALIRATGAAQSSLTYDIQASTPDSVTQAHSKDQFHFSSATPATLSKPSEIYPLFVVHTYGRGVIKDGYKIQQIQRGTSKGQSYGPGRPSQSVIAKAKKELALAENIRSQIASRYLVAPYVVVTITLNDGVNQTINLDAMSAKNYTADIAVYNYPNGTIPISSETHKGHVRAFTEILKKEFITSDLTYKTDLPSCDIINIDASTSSTLSGSECFRS